MGQCETSVRRCNDDDRMVACCLEQGHDGPHAYWSGLRPRPNIQGWRETDLPYDEGGRAWGDALHRSSKAVRWWVNVADGQPPDHMIVIGWTGNHYRLAYRFSGEWFSQAADQCIDEGISDWMMLPEPPASAGADVQKELCGARLDEAVCDRVRGHDGSHSAPVYPPHPKSNLDCPWEPFRVYWGRLYTAEELQKQRFVPAADGDDAQEK